MKRVKLAIDFGSANMKMAGKIDGNIYKELIKSQANTTSVSNPNVVELNGETVYFGSGDSLVKQNKTKRKYVIESILFATNTIYGHLDDKFEIQLGIGLPLKQYMTPEKDDYKNELEKLYLNKDIIGKVNGKTITIKITYLDIYAEGYSGFVALMDNMETNIPVLIIDMGYKTTDVVGVKRDTFSEELIIDNYGTISRGMLEILKDVTDQFIYDSKPTTTVTIDNIEESIVNNTDIKIYTNTGRTSKNPKQWLKYGKNALSSIMNEIEVQHFPDMKLRNVYLIGGGVEIINTILNNQNTNEIIETEQFNSKENDILMYANVKGYLIQLTSDTIDIVESEDIFIPDNKLKNKIAITNE